MFNNEELAGYRRMQEEAMLETAEVYRNTLSNKPSGGFSQTEQLVMTTRCRVSVTGRSPEEKIIAERAGVTMAYTLTFPAGTEIREADRVVITASGTGMPVPRKFDVIAPVRRSYETARRVVCEEKL